MNPFATPTLCGGYATARPAVHPHIAALIRKRTGTVSRALDVGCGTGLSTAALTPIARDVFGIDPSLAMLRHATGGSFAAAAAEHLPFASKSMGLVTAAGSLNWADVAKFFREARRVLDPDGAIVVYDFSTAREFYDGDDGLSEWFNEFEARYPWPPAREITLDTLRADAIGFELCFDEEFRFAVPMSAEQYVEYLLTETNVGAAIERGTPAEDIRVWCRVGIDRAFDGLPRDLAISGYVAYLA